MIRWTHCGKLWSHYLTLQTWSWKQRIWQLRLMLRYVTSLSTAWIETSTMDEIFMDVNVTSGFGHS